MTPYQALIEKTYIEPRQPKTDWQLANVFRAEEYQMSISIPATVLYLHPEVVEGHVLTIHVEGVVLGHRQHLLQVGLDLAAVLMVDGVPVAGDWRTLVAPDVWVGNIEPGVGQPRAFRRRWRVLSVLQQSLRWRGSVGRGHVDPSTYTAPPSHCRGEARLPVVVVHLTGVGPHCGVVCRVLSQDTGSRPGNHSTTTTTAMPG